MPNRVIARTAAVFVVAMAAGLAQALPGLPGWEELYTAFITSVVLTGGYLGIGAATPLEPSIGKKNDV
jgi:hypothetical protein